MAQQTTAPIETLNLEISGREATGLVDEHLEGLLYLDAPYQRGFVWTREQRQGLVRSWLAGLPIPTVILNDRRHGGWTLPDGTPDFRCAVVDGKQRLQTAIAWFAGELAVPASWFAPDEVATTTTSPDEGPLVTFADLTEPGRRYFKRLAKFPVATAHVHTLAEEAQMYLLVNGAGTVQTDADLANAAFYAAGN